MRKALSNLVVPVAVLALIAGCGGQFENAEEMVKAAKIGIAEIAVHDLKSIMDKKEDYVLIDCREGDEFAAGHIPGAVNIPRGLIEFKITKKYPDRNTAIILCCKNGGRGALTAEALEKLKYKKVKSVAGGWEAWNKTNPPAVGKVAEVPEEVKAMVAAAKKNITEIQLADFKAIMGKEKGYVLIDCREPSEFSAGNIPGSVNTPRGLLEFKITKKFPDRKTNIILYCKKGGRAALAAESLQRRLEYENVKSLAGGWKAWAEAAAAPTKEVKAMVKSVKEGITEILLKDFKAKKDGEDEFVLIDCRQANEFKAGHIPGAINIPRGLLEFKITKKFPDRKTNIILYCKKGGRAALAAESLQRRLEYKKMESLAGGFKAWSSDAANPIAKPTEENQVVTPSPATEKKAPVAVGGCGD